jgi:hypothetical protein
MTRANSFLSLKFEVSSLKLVVIVLAGAAFVSARPLFLAAQDAPACHLSAYRAQPGLTATVAGDALTLTWDGDRNEQGRLQLTVERGTPTIRELAVRRAGGAWATIASGARPEFRVVSGLRRITNQQLDPLAGLGIPITQAIVDREKWEAFWDAPLNVPGGDPAHSNCTPPQRGVLTQPGLPRSPDEITRASAVYHVTGCDVTTNGARLEVSFPGVTLGVFSGRLQFTVYKGSNLIRQEIVAKTDAPSVAYKYDAGIAGVPVSSTSRLLWKGITNLGQENRLGGAPNEAPVTVKSSNRIIVAEGAGGSIAAFPPPHTFFWARETSYNLGYNWYQKIGGPEGPPYDGKTGGPQTGPPYDRKAGQPGQTFSLGVRQAESEESPEQEGRGTEDRHQNFALYSARPGTWQRMPVYLYISAEGGDAALASAAAFTRDDHFKAVPGYQVMATHFHMGLVGRARQGGGPDARVPDLEVLKAVGVNIAAPIDGGGGFVASQSTGGDPDYGGDDPHWLQWTRGLGAAADDPKGIRAAASGRTATGATGTTGTATTGRAGGGRGAGAAADTYRVQAEYYETAKRQSDKNFVVLPNSEMIRGDVTRALGGHSDVVTSHPVYWTQGRTAGQPLSEPHPTYGTVYHVGSAADMMEMAHRENMLLFMPHPRSKGSAGFPDAIKDTAHFLDPNYRGIGFRWGMGLDGSETRLCEYRCLPLWDDMNNWVADTATPPKYMQAISEIYQQGYGDDVYANNPVNYVKVATLPPPGDWTPIVDAMKNGEYFISSGEVLIPSFAVQGAGARRTIVADVEWTFPLEFVEIVSGDGVKTDRQVIPATDLPAFGRHHFEVPWSAAGRKWVRFAAWDSAGNGAMVQPIKLDGSSGSRGFPLTLVPYVCILLTSTSLILRKKSVQEVQA